jgi:hypothetical protein
MRAVGTMLALAGIVLGGASCASSEPDALLVIGVRGRAGDLRQLRAVLTVAGKTSQPTLAPALPAPGELAMPLSIALRIPVGVHGTGDLVVEALDAEGAVIQRLALQATVIAGQSTWVDLCFGTEADCPPLPVDAGITHVDGGGGDVDGGPQPVDAGSVDATPPGQCQGEGDCSSLNDTCSMGHCNGQHKCDKVAINQGGDCGRTCQATTQCSYGSGCAQTGTHQQQCIPHTCQAGVCTAGQVVTETTSSGCARNTNGVKCTTQAWCDLVTDLVQCECQSGGCVNPCGMNECRNL